MVAIRLLAAFIRNQIKPELAFRRFDAAVAVAGRDLEIAQLHFRGDMRAWRNVAQRLLQDLDALAHLEHPDVIAVIHVAGVAHGHAEIETAIDAVVVHFAHVILDTAGTGHRTGDTGVDGEFLWQNADTLGAHEQDFVGGEQFLKLIEEPRIAGGDVLRSREVVLRQIHADATEPQVIAHHARAAHGFKQVENPFPLAERVQQRRAPRAEVLQHETDDARMILQTRQLRHDDPDVVRAFGDLDARELLDGQRVRPVVGHGAEIVEAVGIGHRTEPDHPLRELFVIAMQVAHDRLERDDRFAVQRAIHAKHPVRARMLRPDGDFQRLRLNQAFRPRRQGVALLFGERLDHFFFAFSFSSSSRAVGGIIPPSCAARCSVSSCGVGSHS